MPSYNNIHLIGHVGKKPETTQFAQGSKTSFSLAVSQHSKTEEKTLWLNIEIWNNNFVDQYVEKGDLVFVDGALAVDEWEKDGQRKSRTYIKAWKIELLKSAGQKARQEADVRQEPDDDVPF